MKEKSLQRSSTAHSLSTAHSSLEADTQESSECIHTSSSKSPLAEEQEQEQPCKTSQSAEKRSAEDLATIPFVPMKRIRGKTNCSHVQLVQASAVIAAASSDNAMAVCQIAASDQRKDESLAVRRGRGRPCGPEIKKDCDIMKRSREGKKSSMSIWTKVQLLKAFRLHVSETTYNVDCGLRD